jgi:hypothetical protein
MRQAICWVLLTVVAIGASAGESSPPAEGTVDFTQSVRPIFARSCFRCHGPDKQKAGLRLDRRDGMLRGGESGKAVVPGKSGESLLIKRLIAEDADQRMPSGAEPLPRQEIDLLRRWIDQGAHWPSSDPTSTHWSFKPIRVPALPQVQHRDWLRDPIDQFILARLEKDHIFPSPEADRATLLRRLTLDLTGLPPTPAEFQAFVHDDRPDAYERLADRLLASPHFGERFGEHWLDLARYADSDGFEQDDPRPYAYRWRDWVIRAVNADLPYDRFTIEQLAGDLLPGAGTDEILASGFHRNAPANNEGGVDKEEARLQALVDRVNTTGTVWLGLTVGCAECHSHKFDPLPQSEYYQLLAFFNDDVDEASRAVTPTQADLLQHQRSVAAYERRLETLRKGLATAGGEERQRIERFIARLVKTGPPRLAAEVAVFGKAAKPRQTYVHMGGDYKNRGGRVKADVPAVLPKIPARRGNTSPPDRLDLARWLVDPANPLTARVEVNRIWQYLFGAGIVATPDDFGTQGDPPSHPELLDHLASRFIQSGWSRKALIRAIVNSATYRQSSTTRTDVESQDPSNRLLHRQNRFRLEAEVVHDLVLAVGGILDERMEGPCARPPLPDSFKAFAYKFQWNPDASPACYRRGIYIFFQRNMVYPMLRTFDRSDTNLTCVKRERSNTPLQALTLLNDPQFLAAFRSLALRSLRDSHQSMSARIDAMVLLCLGRPPSDAEREVLARLWESLRLHYHDLPAAATALVGNAPGIDLPADEIAAWIGVGRAIINADSFVTRE